MEIEYYVRYSNTKRDSLVEDYIASSLYDSTEQGCTEQAEANAVSAQEALGRLVNILCERGAITVEDLLVIAGTSYNNEEIKVKI